MANNGSNWKATPALIIGLGGTGVRVLTHLKKDLITLNDGVLPGEVRLLAYDTVDRPNVVVGGEQAEGNEVSAGVRLDVSTGEYVHIGGKNIRDFFRSAATGNAPHISSWLQANYYLDTLQEAQFFLEKGAGMLRQFGRGGLYHDVQAPNLSRIYNTLRSAIQHVQNTTNAQTIELAIIASTAGGTGAGMFIDIAHLVRQIAHPTQIRLRGFLVLPEAFRMIPSGMTRDMKARSYAALRETRRFMVNFDWKRGYPMYYHGPTGHDDSKDVWQGRIQNKLFDYMYLIDGRRPQNDLSQYLPDDGVTASIADMISAILDVRGGAKFTEHENNMNDVVKEQKGVEGLEKTANYGTIGTYTIVLPVYHMVEGFAHQLSLETLQAWLQPAALQDGVPQTLAVDQNQDAGIGRRGQDEALAFLRMTQVVDAHDTERGVTNTRLIPEIANVAARYSPDNPNIVRELAGRQLDNWLEVFIPPGDSPEVVEIVQGVNARLRRSVTEIPTSNNVRGEKPSDGLRRIEDSVRKFKAQHLGSEDAQGRRDGGDYRQALQQLAAIQKDRFRLMLNYHTKNVLNGRPQADPVRAKSGRLGYLHDLFVGLKKEINTFLKVMAEVRDEREKRGLRRSMVGQTQGSAHEMREKANSRVSIFATRAQSGYLEAEQRLVEVLRQEVLEDIVTETARDMVRYIEGALEEVESWINTLAVGNDSLFAQLLRGQEQLKANRAADKKVMVRQIIEDPQYESQLYSRGSGNGQAMAEIIEDLTWDAHVEEQGAQKRFDLNLTVGGLASTNNYFTQGGRRDNRELFLRRTAQPFGEIRETETVLKYLKQKYGSNPAQLGRQLAAQSGLMLQFRPATGSVPANYLRIAHGTQSDDLNFLTAVLTAVSNQTQAGDRFRDSVNSADPYKTTLVYTVDVIPLDNITSYSESEGDYRNFRSGLNSVANGREILHLFPAEVNAVKFEGRLGELGENPRLLNDRVVTQLELADMARLFANCLIFRLIERQSNQQSDGGQMNFYALVLPEEDLDAYTKLPHTIISLTQPVTGNPDLVQAMGQFIYEGHDVEALSRVVGDPRTINYDRVRRVLERARQELGEQCGKQPGELRKVEEQALEAMLKEPGGEKDANALRILLGQRNWLKQQQERLIRPFLASSDQIERDLATVLLLMVRDEIKSLDVNIQQKTMYYA